MNYKKINLLIANLPSKKFVMRRYCCEYNGRLALYPPVELLYLHAIAERVKGVNVQFIDAIANKLTIKSFLNQINTLRPDFLVFLSGYETIREELHIAAQAKEYHPHMYTIVTGYLPTVFPNEILASGIIDFILCGEPELTWEEFLRSLVKGYKWVSIPGLAYQRRGKIYGNSPRERIENLDNLLFPSYDVININNYWEFMFPRPIAAIQTSRGCPHKCIYCVKTYGTKYVVRSPENVVDEIEKLCKLGIHNIRFLDDTFTEDSEHVMEICRLILKRQLKIKWICLSRSEGLTKNLLKIMYQSGCRRMCLGIESGSEKMLRIYKKNYELGEVRKCISLVRSANIEAAGFFMVGGPEEGCRDFNMTLRFARDLKLDYAIAESVKLYPNTRLTKMFEQITKQKLGLFDAGKPINAISSEWEKKFFRNFYSQPQYIIYHLGMAIRHPIISATALYKFIV